jgi:type IV secretion system protein VirB5
MPLLNSEELLILDEEELDQRLPPEDPQGNEAFTARWDQNRTLKHVCTALSVLVVMAFGAVVVLAMRPPIVRYIRIDSIGRATAIQYSDLNYTPKEGEVRRFLEDYAKYSYTLLRSTVQTSYKYRFYFLDRNRKICKPNESLKS